MIRAQRTSSPRWSNTTKLVVGLTIVAIVAGLLIKFSNFVVPIMLAFMLAYILYPVADRLRKCIKTSWRITVTIIYLLLVFILLGLLVWGGINLVEQAMGLLRFLQRALNDIPGLIEELSSLVFQIGPFVVDMSQYDLNILGEQILNAVQPVLSNIGVLVGSFASGAASTIGMTLVTILISYFVLAETAGIPGRLLRLSIPGYQDDIRRLGIELNRIWNAFLRGQIMLFTIAVLIYLLILGTLGIKFYYLLALVAGFARLVPYVGPPTSWVIYTIVAFFQASNPFDLQPIFFAALMLGIALITDAILDSVLTPRILADALRVHPAAVLVATLVTVSLLGVVGVLVAAPIFATFQLILRYAARKLFDMDPWADMKISPPTSPLAPVLSRVKKRGGKLGIWIRKRFFTKDINGDDQRKESESDDENIDFSNSQSVNDEGK